MAEEEFEDDEPKEEYSAVKKEQDINSLKIVKERLAKGEISKDEYDDLKKEFEK